MVYFVNLNANPESQSFTLSADQDPWVWVPWAWGLEHGRSLRATWQAASGASWARRRASLRPLFVLCVYIERVQKGWRLGSGFWGSAVSG